MLDNDVIVEIAPAKLNLALHVRRRRADGYHELETLFAFARDGDVVTAAPAETDSFVMTGPFASALSGEGDNLVTRAARAFVDAFAPDTAHAIALEKILPIASGIGGGSADAAATLRALARLHGVEAGDTGLVAVARALGADVPACLLGRTALGTGRGDDLIPLEPLGGMPALLVNPRVAVATGPVFAGWDGVDRGGVAREGDVMTRARAGRNDLAAPAIATAPVIADLLAWLEARPGAAFVRMSGSGATCLALFDSPADRHSAAAALRTEHPDWWALETALA
ncbi:4-(cytidine 5'-diphospho)-2-C-methyl-D-erythritol kinase [uncultured Sphingomonas sp.]|uniref:4-(cytidine 5'-diphospho)-2-C-methyl-D-erythritol kinase n=1 Tax=uncultured Sphingomonas sp. TaxID=158754 RepID=UPI0035CAB5C1